jgi:hypothetical protein
VPGTASLFNDKRDGNPAVSSSPNLDVNLGATPATRKISASSRDQACQLLNDARRISLVLHLELADHGRHHETIRTVPWSLIQGKQLTGTYASPCESKPKRLTLHPYRLCLVKQAWYLIARPGRRARRGHPLGAGLVQSGDRRPSC